MFVIGLFGPGLGNHVDGHLVFDHLRTNVLCIQCCVLFGWFVGWLILIFTERKERKTENPEEV